MRRLSPHLAPLGYSPRRYLPLSPAPVLGMGERLTDLREMQLLFANGEQGGYWPADPAYAYEDSAGTTAASVNGVVGLRVNAIAGYPNAVQTTTANKPYLRRTPTSNKPWYDANTATGALNVTFASAIGRRNLLTYTEDFSAWLVGIYGNHARSTITSNTDIAPDGSLTADTLTCTHASASTIGNATPTIKASANQVFTISCWVKSSNISTFRFFIAYGTSGYSVGNYLGDTVSLPITIINSWVRYSFTTQLPNNASITTVQACISFSDATVGTTMQVWGAQLETGTTPTDYQKIVAGPSAVLDPTALAATYPQNISASTNCTVACVTPEGVVIADNQTVGTTYNITPPFDYNSDVLIINRALTAAERALVTRVMQRSVPRLSFKAAVTFNDLSEWSDTTDCSVSDGKLTITPVPNATWRYPVSTVVFNFIAGYGYILKWRSLAPSTLFGVSLYGVAVLAGKNNPGTYLTSYFSTTNQSTYVQFRSPYPAAFDMLELHEIL